MNEIIRCEVTSNNDLLLTRTSTISSSKTRTTPEAIAKEIWAESLGWIK